MSKFLLTVIGLLALNAQAALTQQCVMTLNSQLMPANYGGGRLFVDQDGKIGSLDPKGIVSTKIENGVETVVYKGSKMEAGKVVPATHTIIITRKNGKIVNFNLPYDIAFQVEMNKQTKEYFDKNSPKTPFNTQIFKSQESSISYEGDNCSLDQSMAVISRNGGPDKKEIFYDSQFCKALEPLIREMGANNAAKCSALISQAETMQRVREKDLNKEGKTFFQIDIPGMKPGTGQNINSVMAIGNCTGPMAGYAVGGMGGSGMGMGNYGIGSPMTGYTSADKKAAKATQ